MDYPDSIEAVVRRDLLDLYAVCLATVMRSEIDFSSARVN